MKFYSYWYKYINNVYLNIKFIKQLSQRFLKQTPIQYLVLDDFINPKFYKNIEYKLLTFNNFSIVNKRKNTLLSNKTIIFDISEIVELYNFFISQYFELFLMLFFNRRLEKYRKYKLRLDGTIDNNLNYSQLAICQLYEKDDFLDWHTDIAKDMKRQEYLKKWWYFSWDKYIVKDYDEIWAFIYYVYNSNDNWKEEYGGVLELWRVDKDEIIPYKKIFPLRNRLVLIKSSNYSYHRVTRVIWNHFRITIQDLLYKFWAAKWDEILY